MNIVVRRMLVPPIIPTLTPAQMIVEFMRSVMTQIMKMI